MNPSSIQAIDAKLLELHGKLKNTDNIVIRHRLVQEIDRLLDERKRLKP